MDGFGIAPINSRSFFSTIIFLICISAMVAPMAMATTSAGQTQTILAGQAPQGISSDDWKDIQGQIQAKHYQSYPDNSGGFNASNRAHNWKIRFQDSGITSLSPKTDNSYQIDMKLTALGYQQLVSVDYPTQVTSKGNITTYQWSPELREIWTNSAHSLEQWFVLEQRPPKSDGECDNKLQLKLSLDTGLSIKQKPGGLYFSDEQGLEISYTKLKVWDKNGTIMPSQIAFAGNSVTLQIDDSQAQYPLTIDPLFQQQAYLKASNTGVDDIFGGAVAVSGDTVVVGALGEDSSSTGVDSTPNNLAGSAGAAYVFIRSGVTWSQQAYLKASNTDEGDLFGYSVSVSGDTVVVGAPREDSSSTGVDSISDNSAGNAGAAYVFTRNGVTWSQKAYLKAFNTGADDRFGRSVSVAGDTVVVGARWEGSSSTGVDSTPNNSAARAGAAYVFTRNGVIWSQQAYLKASNTDIDDWFGVSVAVSGDTVVVGALGEDSSSTGVDSIPDELDSNSGAAYVFIRNSVTWSQQAYLKASNTGVDDWFGVSVAVSGDSVVVGAFGENSSSTGVDSVPDEGAINAGAAYVFTRNGVIWSQQAYLKAANTDDGDLFGNSAAISGDTIVVGARWEDSSTSGVGSTPNNSADNTGAAYVFSRNGVIWSQQAYLKASNTDDDDLFGMSIAVSGDTVVVGVFGEDSSSTGVDSMPDELVSNAGAAYVFILDTTTPVASGVSITGTAVVGEQLTGGYVYSDVDNDLEGSTTFRWLRDGVAIVGATGTSYTLVAADTGTTITFEVTPVAATGVSPGAPATSGELITIRSQALFSDNFE